MGRLRLATGILLFSSLLGGPANQRIAVSDSPELHYACPILPARGNHRSVTVRVPANAVIVLQSLDLTGALHRFELSTTAASDSDSASPSYSPFAEFTNVQRSTAVEIPSADLVSEIIPTDLRPRLARPTALTTSHQTSTACHCDSCASTAGPRAAAAENPDSTRTAEKAVSSDSTTPSQLRTFLAPGMIQGTICSVITQGTLAATIDNVAVYFSSDVSRDPAEERQSQILTRLKQFLATGLRQQVALEFGEISDIDGSGGLTILIGAMQDRTTATQSDGNTDPPLLGAVRQSDFLDPQANPGGDIIYLDSDLPLDAEFDSLLVHELTHAAICSRLRERSCHGRGTLTLPAWIHELLAHAGEQHIAGASRVFSDRLRQFHDSPETSPVCSRTEHQSLQATRGGSRAAAIRLLQFAGGPQQHVRCSLLTAETGTDFLEQLLGNSLPRLLPQWSLIEAAEILSDHPHAVRQLETEQTRECCIYGSGFAVLRLPNTATLLTISSAAAADWTLTALPP